MLSNSLARRYALALYSMGKEKGNLQELERQLVQICQIITGNHDLNEAYMNPVLPTEAKHRIIDDIFEGEIIQELKNFLKLLADKKRTPYLPLILEELTALVDLERNAIAVTVTTAVALDEGHLAKLKSKLEAQTGKSVRLNTKVDPRIIGGVVLKMDNAIVDGSVRYRLDAMRQYLRQGGVGANSVIG